jgi:polysaccharide biosynthesis protein VpsQ
MTKPASMIWLSAGTMLFAAVILLISLSATLGWGLAWFERVRQIPGGDKLAHFVLMGGLSLLVNLSLRARQVRVFGGRILLGSLVLYILVTIEEFTQLLLPSRSFDLADLASNYLGIFLFGWLAMRLSAKPNTSVGESN